MRESSPTPDPEHSPASPEPSGPEPGGLSRRGMLRLTSVAGVAAAALPALAGTAFAAAPSASPNGASQNGSVEDSTGARPSVVSTFDPIRPPATPLAVRSPYLSAWLATDNLPGAWPSFWTGHTVAMAGIVRVDGQSYTFMGSPSVNGVPAPLGAVQTNLTVTATSSVFTLLAGGVRLVVSFLSPVEPGDLKRQSMPLSYLSITASSADHKSHQVSVYVDISGEWAHGDTNQKVSWAASSANGVESLTITPANPTVLAEWGDQASWGTVLWSSPQRPGLTYQIGGDQVVRGAALTNGRLDGSVDGNQPRAINDNWPVLGLNLDLGTVRGPSEPFVVSIGHVREPAISYLGAHLSSLWTAYWPNWQAMVADFHQDFAGATDRATALDERIDSDATSVGGPRYAALCALAVRQAYGGTELVVRNGKPWAFLKEISSDGNVSTVDVTYPGTPVFLYLDPQRLGLLLEPLLDYPENGGWPKEFAQHDLGSSYPNATGHNDGKEEDMPVEESANMLIMTSAYLHKLGSSEAKAFATAHYAILKKWADYLVANALDPGYQNQTDDFTGFIAHSVNLALKGIIGIGAMGQIATAAGNSADAASYLATSRSYIAQWAQKAQDTANLKLAYDQPGTWSLKYNGYPDTLLGTNLVPDAVRNQEAALYLARRNQFGFPLDDRHSYTKTDWELWTAAWQNKDTALRDAIIGDIYDFANTTGQRVPFTDWYDTISGHQNGFQARPVIGGVFALLSLFR